MQAVSATTSLTILGLTVNTSTVSDNEFKNLDDTPMGRTAFYAAAGVGTLVKARADLSGGTPVWNQMELED